MLLSILGTLISLFILALCLYFAVLINLNFKESNIPGMPVMQIAKRAAYKAAPLTGACIMAIKVFNLPVGYLLAIALFSCLYTYEFISLKFSTGT